MTFKVSVKKVCRIALVAAFSGALLYAQDQPARNSFSASGETETKQQRVSATNTTVTPTPSENRFAGRLTCAGLATGSYKCAKNQTVWACTLQCAETQSHYALQSADGMLIPIVGQLNLLQRFAGDRVVVTGTVTEGELNTRYIEKSEQPRRDPPL